MNIGKYISFSIALFIALSVIDGSDFVNSPRSEVLSSKVIRKLALKGDPEKQMLLGLLHTGQFGGGYRENKKQALKWLTKSADSGYQKSMEHLSALLKRYGQLQESFRWAKKAAENGGNRCLFDLSLYYADGIGTEQDGDKAIAVLLKASNQGHASSKLLLASIFLGNRPLKGIEEDSDRGLELMLEVAEEGSVLAQEMLGEVYLYKFEEMEPALLWYTRAANNGSLEAQFLLGKLYLKGSELGYALNQDYGKSRDWFEKAAYSGSKEALYELALIHRDGLGTPPDPVQAHAYMSEVGPRIAIRESFQWRNSVVKHLSEEQKVEAEKLSKELARAIRESKKGTQNTIAE